MARNCTRSFDEELISGYLDGALPQVQSQKVRLHVEDCGACRNLLGELRTLRETAMSTRFKSPADDEWPELPRTVPGRLSRRMGWVVLIAWLLVVTGLALWRFTPRPATRSRSSWRSVCRGASCCSSSRC